MIPALVREEQPEANLLADLPESLKKPFAVLSAMRELSRDEPAPEQDQAMLTAAIASIESYRQRAAMDPGSGYYRAITPQRKEGILAFYEQTALNMYNGFAKQMARYAETGAEQQKHLSALFVQAQKTNPH